MNFTDPKMMALLSAGGSLLQSSGASPRPINLGEAMGNAVPAAMQGAHSAYAFQQQEEQRKKIANEALQRIQAQEFLQKHQQSGSDPRSISRDAMMSGNPILMGMAGDMMKSMPKVKSTIKGYDESGNPVFHNVMDTGEVSATNIRPAEKMSFQNTGQETLGIDPFTGERRLSLQNSMAPGEQARLAQSAQQFGASHGLARENQGIARQNNDLQRQRMMMEMDPEFQAQKAGMIAGAKESATSQVKAQRDLPNVVQQGEETIRLVDDLLKHPGFGISVGKTAPLGSLQSFIPGTQASSFDIALKQLKGKQFLEAFESLKGGGQITQIEGEKATQAMSRMDKANTEDEFKKAAQEFQGIIRNGINRAKIRTGQQQPAQQPQQQPSSSDGWGDLR
jgi:hypothetical protein